MLNSSQVIEQLLKIKKNKSFKIVLDPVMIAKGGAKLINKTAIKTLKETINKKSLFNYSKYSRS